MERELGRFGERAQQNQGQGDRIHGMSLYLVSGCQHVIKLEAANNVADDQDAGEQCKAAAAGYRECHPGATAGVLFMGPETDQQERGQAGQFPENHHQEEVA